MQRCHASLKASWLIGCVGAPLLASSPLEQCCLSLSGRYVKEKEIVRVQHYHFLNVLLKNKVHTFKKVPDINKDNFENLLVKRIRKFSTSSANWYYMFWNWDRGNSKRKYSSSRVARGWSGSVQSVCCQCSHFRVWSHCHTALWPRVASFPVSRSPHPRLFYRNSSLLSFGDSMVNSTCAPFCCTHFAWGGGGKDVFSCPLHTFFFF